MMTQFFYLKRGNKQDMHLTLYKEELEILDAMREEYNCSRAAIIGALLREHAGMNLTDKVAPGRRPGGGRKKKGT